jgi:isoleucyl-tRNA synthetase
MSELAALPRKLQKVENQVDFPALEETVLKFWDTISAFEKLRQKGIGKPIWSFLDGPITANNPMGVHHAWGRTYKDVYNRYFAMTGHELRWQNGFDCQGLWVEVEVEKELKLNSKRDIESIVPGDVSSSIAKFTTACKERVNRFARVQTDQSIRLGMWMDWDRGDADWAKTPDERKSYFTMSEKNNYTIWSFLKKCHCRGLIYRGYDVMPWCGRCGVGISEMEKAEGYKLIEHRSVFVKFPLGERPGENLLVWTTTPWTLTSNVAAAVNPELIYLKIKLRGEIYYVAKGAFKVNRMESTSEEEGDSKKKSKREWLDGVPHLKTIEQMFKEKSGKEGFEFVGELKGSEMLGWAYSGPFDELPAQNATFGFPDEVARIVKVRGWSEEITGEKAHRVIAWKDVGETEGTGIVHIAPGCGQADLMLGKENKLPPIAPLDDSGCYHEGFGELSGRSAVDPKTADLVFEKLKAQDRLFTIERYVHKYPHCWRCKTELLFRLVDEWFIDMKWRDEIMRVVEQVKFLPENLNGQARELDWLRNMGDWMISKKRYWGLALPIWVDEHDPTQFEVIGSREELKERAIEGWDEFDGQTPHRPWVDNVVILNPKTGNKMRRVSDVGNPWLDAGIVGFSTMKFDTDRAYWEKWYPADFITESFPGQFRNWFYALLAMSTMMSDGKPPFKTLLGFATVRDQFGQDMHKSAGNSIEFIGAASHGYELFKDLKPTDESKLALEDLPKGLLSTREETVTVKGEPKKRVFAKYRPIGADVVRWFYCRHNPASNINFGPEPTDEVRSKFILKLWNTYGFFVNYARLDNFDRAATPVPLSERTDLDRWILSDLQKLIATSHEMFRSYDVESFCEAMEKYIDDKLSNWYVRRNRRRFWKSEKGDDKLAAYQTLYTVLLTVTKLCAPVIPFLTEVMYQNLKLESDPESVHLCDYPQVDERQLDESLSDETNALLNLVSLGSAARNQAKIKVRQPLAELLIRTEKPAEQRAIQRFPEQIGEELNLKKVTLVEAGTANFLRAEAKLNMKTAAAKIGPKLNEVKKDLASRDPLQLAKLLSAGPVVFAGIELLAGDIQIEFKAEEGFIGVVEKGTEAKLDIRITQELKLEGLAREVIRRVQDLRKTSGLEMEDRIALYIKADGKHLPQAVMEHRNYIASETLTEKWLESPMEAKQGTDRAKIEGDEIVIELKKLDD